jgi:hypothetical protein
MREARPAEVWELEKPPADKTDATMKMLKKPGTWFLLDEHEIPDNVVAISTGSVRVDKWYGPERLPLKGMAVLAGVDLMAFPGSKEAAEIFNWLRTILPVLAGLVLGFNFGRISQ